MKTYFASFKQPLGFLFFLGLIATSQVSCDAQAKGNQYLVNIDKSGVILDGYDPVAFFTENKPVKGNPSISTNWHDAIYHFSSEAHKALFMASPEKYAPQYGAYCGYAVSLGHLAPIDVNYFAIIDGRLILQHNQKALNGWNENPNSLQLADKYWPKLLGKKGKPIIPDEEKKYLVNVNDEGFIAEGYDVVAYFTDNKPVKGDPAFVKLYNGAFYTFASEEHKQLFGADPMKYIPQYGGYCAYAVSLNKLRPIDPKYFQFVDGRLMLQHSQDALDSFSEDIPGNTVKADKNWPGLVEKKKGKQAPGQYDEAVKK
ncbi:MAG: YHS domain-containing (seleno)protein [Saprospiraceae bacterium]